MHKTHTTLLGLERVLRWFMPLEVLLVVTAGVTVVSYWFLGITVPGAPGNDGRLGPTAFYIRQLVTSLDLYAIIITVTVATRSGLVLRSHGWELSKVPWKEFWSKQAPRFHLSELWHDLRLFNALVVMFVLFALLKNLIPHINPMVFDEWFIASEHLLCGGELCATRLHHVLGHGVATGVGKHYHWYYPYMSVVAFTFIAAADRKIAEEYITAFCLLFLVGVTWVYLVPTWGPIYSLPEQFEALRGTDTHQLQYALWHMKEQLEQDPTRTDAVFMISGFPSLHVAVVVLGSLYLKHIHPWLALLSWSFTLLVIHSTIYLGWHYVLDDVGSVVLVLVCVWLARRLTVRFTARLTT